MQAFEQLKAADPVNLRPPVPGGGNPHLCFRITFRGEHVEGEDGPYRQFFSDITNELRAIRIDDRAEAEEDDVDLDSAEEKPEEEQEESACDVHLNLLVASRNMQTNAEHGKDKFAINPRMDG
jgi:hypothetical protein